MSLDDKKMQRIRSFLQTPSGQNALKALGQLGTMKDEQVLKEIWRIIPRDDLPERTEEDLGIIPDRRKFTDEVDEEPKKPENPGLFGEPLGSAETDKILEHIRGMGLEA